MEKESFKESLEFSLPLINDWNELKKEFDKFKNNAKTTITLDKILKIPSHILNYILSLLDTDNFDNIRKITKNKFKDKSVDIKSKIHKGGDSYSKIYDLNKKQYYHIQ